MLNQNFKIGNKHSLSTPKNFDLKNFVDSFIEYYNTKARSDLEYFFHEMYSNSKNITLVKGGDKK
jgi:hypothetical protein